ncbi:unnamed protein product [Closterium sp. NIES-53]
MASLRVLAFDHEGRPIQFDTWLDDLQLYLLSDSRDNVSLFDHTSGAAPAPPATGDSATRSQWLTHDVSARLAIRNHLLLAECTHFGQHRTAEALYDSVVVRYSSPATATLRRLPLPYLFPELSAFATVEDLVSHLRTNDARYRAALPAEFLAKIPPPMYITLYFIVTHLHDSLCAVRDHFLALDPTALTVDLLEQHLLAAETSVVVVGAARGTRTPFFEGCSPSPLAPSYTFAAAVDVLGAEDVGAASTSGKRRISKGKGGRGGGGGSAGGGGGSSGGGGGSGGGGSGGSDGGSGGFGGGGGGSSGSGGSGSGESGGGRTGAQRGGYGGGHRQRQQRRSESLLPQYGVEIFDLDYDAILSAMYALSASDEGDCCWYVPLDPGIEAAALGASESSLPGTVPAEALHTFTLDSGASRCFFRDSTTLTPLRSRVPVRLADPSGGLVVARSSTVLPCPAVPSGSLSGLHLPLLFCGTTAWVTPPCHDFVACTPVSLSLVFPGLCLPYRPCLPRPAFLASRGGSALLLTPPSFPRRLLPCRLSTWTFRLQLREQFRQDLPILRRHSGRGGEFFSDLLWDFFCGEGILQSFTLPDSPQQNGIAERRIGVVMEVARTSMIHAVAPHFLWPFAVRCAAHQLNLWPRVSLPEISMTLSWTGKVGDATVFWVWGSCAFVRNTSADKLSPHAIPCIFLGFSLDAPSWQFYHPTSRRVFPSQDVTFDESTPSPPGVLLPGGAEFGGSEPGGAEPAGVEPGGVEPGGVEPEGVEPGGPAGASPSLSPRPENSPPQQLLEWLVWRARLRSGATRAGGTGDAGAGGTGVTAGTGGTGGTVAAGPGGARTRGTGATGTGGVGGAGAGDPTEPGVAGDVGVGAGGTSAGGAGAGGAGAVGAGAGGTCAGGARAGGAGAVDPGAGGTVRP